MPGMNSDTKIITIIVIITVIIVSLGLIFTSSQSASGTQASINQDILVRQYTPSIAGKAGSVQIVEFGDFECPSCAMLHPTMSRILKDYGDKVSFAYRIIPIHRSSRVAAAVAYAAGEQGLYFQMFDKLFDNQAEWSAVGADTQKLFEMYAKDIGADISKFNTSLSKNSKLYDQQVDQDYADAVSMSITSTPTIIINSKTVMVGAASYDKIKAVIDAEISGTVSVATSSASSTAN